MDKEELEAAYQSMMIGYEEPNYAQVRLDVFRQMVRNTEEKGIHIFLAECDKNHVPEDAIVVMTPGNLALLVDDEGHLLTFS